MSAVVIAAEVVGSLFLCVIVWGILSQKEKGNQPLRFFFAGVLVTLVATVIDILSYLADASDWVSPALSRLLNLFAICGYDFALPAFMFYAWSFVCEKRRVSSWFAWLTVGFCAADVLLVVVGTFAGKMYSVVDGVFVEGPWFAFVGVLPLVSLFGLMILMLFFRKIVGMKAVLIIGTHFIVPLAAFLVNRFLYEASFVYVADALVMMIVYVSLQTGEIEKGHMRERLMMEVSNTDVLTGLNNRRAYDSVLSGSKGSDNYGILFCDLNGLKFTNDTYGHTAGDNLILKFSEFLRSCFDGSEVFRISGDEFVVIAKGITEDAFRTQTDLLRNKNDESDKIAAIGYTYGHSDNVLQLVRLAEMDMYVEKSVFYKDRGIDRRKTGAGI